MKYHHCRLLVKGADNPRLVKVIDLIEKTLKWPLLSGVPLERWVSTSGKVLIMGDAAHPMLPYMSEGMHFDSAFLVYTRIPLLTS